MSHGLGGLRSAVTLKLRSVPTAPTWDGLLVRFGPEQECGGRGRDKETRNARLINEMRRKYGGSHLRDVLLLERATPRRGFIHSITESLNRNATINTLANDQRLEEAHQDKIAQFD